MLLCIRIVSRSTSEPKSMTFMAEWNLHESELKQLTSNSHSHNSHLHKQLTSRHRPVLKMQTWLRQGQRSTHLCSSCATCLSAIPRNHNFLASWRMKASCEYACVHKSGFERACILMSNFSLGLLHERKFVSLNFDLFCFCSSFSSATYNMKRLLYCCNS